LSSFTTGPLPIALVSVEISARFAHRQKQMRRGAQSSDVLHVEAGSPYPALQRLGTKGWVTGKWGQTAANQRATCYRLTPEGKKQLLREESRWTTLVTAIGRVMNSTATPGTEE
jgi:DNA-binding PadR family transcriptional regulator